MNLLTPNLRYPVPEEMKPYPHWVCWSAPGTSGDTSKVPWSPVTGNPASPQLPREWASYEQASAFAAAQGFRGLGFVFSTQDPFAGIDLDDAQGDSKIVEYQLSIFNTFQSYAEISPSGQGLHIIVKGDVPRGRRRNKVEVYSKGRYFTMTGNVYRNVNIIPCQAKLTELYQALGGDDRAIKILDAYYPQELDDQEIWNRAAAARNGQKFQDLWAGNWQVYYPTQSEADFALIDIIAFYTKNREQIIRMYHASALTRREPGKDPNKAYRQDYLEWMLSRCFDRMLPPVDLSFIQEELKLKLEEEKVKQSEQAAAPKPPRKIIPELEVPPPSWPEDLEEIDLLEEDEEDSSKPLNCPFIYPPGLIGDIATFIEQASYLPVKEISLTAAIGLMSGIVGRAYNVSRIGLNQYLLLLARTGTGKESMATGINLLMMHVARLYPNALDFIGPGDFRSDQALVKYLATQSNSFLTIAGEFGLALKEMSGPNAPSHKIGYRKTLLDLYNKSGQTGVLRATVYSEKEKNTKAVKSPAVTLMGESTPKHFYEALDEGMIAEGLLPRFLIIEYKGKRGEPNYDHVNSMPSNELTQRLASLCHQCASANRNDSVINVPMDEQASQIAHKFNIYCTKQINKASNEDISADLWNRAYLKMIKLAALCAVGINPGHPIITWREIRWAEALVVQDCNNIVKRFDTGEVGTGTDERVQLNLVRNTIIDFVKKPLRLLGKTPGYVPNCEMYHDCKVIPYNYVHRKLVGVGAFQKGKYPATETIKRCLQTLVELGDIDCLGLNDRIEKFNKKAAAYVIINMKLLEENKKEPRG